MNHLYHGDCLEVLQKLDPVRCIFADPPDNIGLGYGEYKDRLKGNQYVDWLNACVELFISKAEIVWLSFNAMWTVDMGSICNDLLLQNPDLEVKPCVQVFTFGQHRQTDLGNNHRPLWRIMRKGTPLYPDQIRVESWRQKCGDKRADPRGRVPGDVFDMQYPRTVPAPFTFDEMHAVGGLVIPATEDTPKGELVEIVINPGDVFDFPRVTGNSKQRCDWHPTQLHEDLVERCIKLSTLEGETVLDPFAGTGTTGRVCQRINRPYTLIEYDSSYCDQIALNQGLICL